MYTVSAATVANLQQQQRLNCNNKSKSSNKRKAQSSNIFSVWLILVVYENQSCHSVKESLCSEATLFSSYHAVRRYVRKFLH